MVEIGFYGVSAGSYSANVLIESDDSSARERSFAVEANIGGVVNDRPVAVITSPGDGLTIDQGTPITLIGSGEDNEDGSLNGNSLVWSSSLDGELGTGEELSISSLGIGDHVISLTATDLDGRTGNATVLITVREGQQLPDTTPPTKPGNLASSNITTKSADLQWDASSDASGMVSYEVYQDGDLVGTTRETRMSLAGLSAGKAYEYVVRAFDDARNRSPQSTKVTITTLNDTTAPSQPKNLRSSSVTVSSVDLDWESSTDEDSSVTYKVYQNGELHSSTDSTSIRIIGLNEGSDYQFFVKSVDESGNESEASNAITITTSSSQSGEQIHEIIIDNMDEEVTITGNMWFKKGPNQYGENYFKTQTFTESNEVRTAEFTPNLTQYSGYTEVLIYNPVGSGSSDAPITVRHDHGESLVSVDQTVNNGEWVSIGFYVLSQGSTVTISNESTSGRVMMDAVKFRIFKNSTVGKPPAPIDLASADVSRNSFYLSWDVGDNDTDTTYDIYENGEFITNTELDHTAVYGLAPMTSYTYHIVAKDRYQNASDQSEPIAITTIGNTGNNGSSSFVLDNTDDSIVVTGNMIKKSRGVFEGTNYYKIINASEPNSSFRSVAFFPEVGEVVKASDVYIKSPTDPKASVATPIVVSHDTGTTTVYIDQTKESTKWLRIGTFDLSNSSTITFTNEAPDGRRILVDAIKIVQGIE